MSTRSIDNQHDIKERRAQEEANKKLQDDLQAVEEANLANQKLRQKLAQTLEDVEVRYLH